MRKAVEIMKSGWFLSLVAVLVLCALVWLAGPWVAVAGREPLAPAGTRLATMLALLLAWAVVILVLALRRRAREKGMDQALDAAAAPARVGDERDAASAAERMQLESRFRDAIRVLRRRGGRRSGVSAAPATATGGSPGRRCSSTPPAATPPRIRTRAPTPKAGPASCACCAASAASVRWTAWW